MFLPTDVISYLSAANIATSTVVVAVNEIITASSVSRSNNVSYYLTSSSTLDQLPIQGNNNNKIIPHAPMTSPWNVIDKIETDESYIAVIIGVLSAVAAIFLIILFILMIRHRKCKYC